jgi:hypothetical protein
LKSIASTLGTASVPLPIRIVYFILLLPKFVVYQFSKASISRRIIDAGDELIEHYKLPETKVRQFKLECTEEKEFYHGEIAAIHSEITSLNEKLNKPGIGEKFRNEISKLVKAYEINLDAKLRKYNFYKSCEERLAHIEDQILLQRKLQDSKQKLIALQDDESDSSRLTEIKKEFELYDYYGDLLEDISVNLRRVSEDREQELKESELSAMLSKISLDADRR